MVCAGSALAGLLLLLPLPNVRGRLSSAELPPPAAEGGSPRLAGMLFVTGITLIGFLSAGLPAHLPAPACTLVRATGELTYRTHHALGAVLELGDAGGLGCL